MFGVDVVEFRGITRILFFRISVKVGANSVVFHRNIARTRIMGSALETHVFNKMGCATKGIVFKGRPHATKHVNMGNGHVILRGFMNHAKPVGKSVGPYCHMAVVQKE